MLSNQLPVALALALGSAWVTASLGLHPVFGGFLAGLTMPGADGTPDAEILRPMDEIGGVLLPLFFVVTGLSVNIGALGRTAFVLLAIVCAIASAGKVGPGYVAARVGGLGPRDSAAVAVLVNTRGLTELIALNVGLSAGLIDQRLFSVLVLMALITTIMTSPLLSLIRVPAAALSADDSPISESA
jgi:Kef-type K+ transport system membrane component KefB